MLDFADGRPYNKSMTTTTGFTVFFTNFGYTKDGVFPTVDAALEAAKGAGFEASIRNSDGDVVASWSVFGGVRRYTR
jgi:hypothetical protein